MARLIKMDMRRLFRSPMFYIMMSVVAAFNIISTVVVNVASKIFLNGEVTQTTVLSDAVCSPFVLPILIVLMFISLVSFSYADIVGGYIKNLAGQLPNKSQLIYSKFAVIGIHNLIFLVVGSLANVLGVLIMSGAGMLTLLDDGKVFAAIITLLLKWLLSMAISAILLFVTNGVKNKVLASVTGVIIGTGTLGLAYMGLNTAISHIFHTEGFDIGMYMPDTLMNSVNVGANTAVINAIIVSLVCIVIFMALTVKVFNSLDVK